jgi:hypothetical protein
VEDCWGKEIIGLFNDEWILRGFDAYYFVNVSALAWWY